MEYFSYYDYSVKYVNIYRNNRSIAVEKEYIQYLLERSRKYYTIYVAIDPWNQIMYDLINLPYNKPDIKIWKRIVISHNTRGPPLVCKENNNWRILIEKLAVVPRLIDIIIYGLLNDNCDSKYWRKITKYEC